MRSQPAEQGFRHFPPVAGSVMQYEPSHSITVALRVIIGPKIGSFGHWQLSSGGNMLAVDPDSTIGRILNFIGQNLKVDKLFIDMGFDPNHFTWDAVFHRAAELAW